MLDSSERGETQGGRTIFLALFLRRAAGQSRHTAPTYVTYVAAFARERERERERERKKEREREREREREGVRKWRGMRGAS